MCFFSTFVGCKWSGLHVRRQKRNRTPVNGEDIVDRIGSELVCSQDAKDSVGVFVDLLQHVSVRTDLAAEEKFGLLLLLLVASIHRYWCV